MTTLHKQTRIKHAGVEAGVDKRIAPLILELCQDFPAYAPTRFRHKGKDVAGMPE
jgi:hypothetical protein